MKKTIAERIHKTLDAAGYRAALNGALTATDFKSLMMDVMAARILARRPSDVLRQYEQDRFVRPAHSDPRLAMSLDALLFDLMPRETDILELSPLAPLAAHSAAAPVHPDRILPTIRLNELVGDVGQILALESALKRRRNRGEQPLWLAASQRLVRTQLFSEAAAFAHFRMFGWSVAGRQAGRYGFEYVLASRTLQILQTMLPALKQQGFTLSHLRVEVACRHDALASVLDDLKCGGDFAVDVAVDSEENWAYYDSMRLKVFAGGNHGDEVMIGDGGTHDWTRQYLSDQRERFFSMGLGSERMLVLFGP